MGVCHCLCDVTLICNDSIIMGGGRGVSHPDAQVVEDDDKLGSGE